MSVLTIVVAFFVGCVGGWMTNRLIGKFGSRFVFGDNDARTKLLDGLGYGALLKLQASVEAEIAKRRASS